MDKHKAKEVMGWAMRHPWEKVDNHQARCRVTGRTYPAIWHEDLLMALQVTDKEIDEIKKAGVNFKEVKLYGCDISVV